MSLNFPNSPVDGQVFEDTNSGNRYVYNSYYTVWEYEANTSNVIVSGPSYTSFTKLNSNTVITDIGSYLVDTANGSVYLTMPSATEGDAIFIADGGGDKTVNSIVIRVTSGTVNDANTDFFIDTPNVVAQLIYSNTNWKVFF